jgi:hypothetical protein
MLELDTGLSSLPSLRQKGEGTKRSSDLIQARLEITRRTAWIIDLGKYNGLDFGIVIHKFGVPEVNR